MTAISRSSQTKSKVFPGAMFQGVSLDKADNFKLANALEQVGESREGSLTDLIARFQDWTTANVKVTSIIKCPDCGGTSDLNLDECPYCGATDDPPAQTTESTAAPVAKNSKPVQVSTSPVVEPPTTERKKEGANMDSTSTTNGVSTPKATKKGAKKADKTEAALAKTTPEATAIVLTESEILLNKEVEKVRYLKSNAAMSHFDLGLHIRTNIFESNLWKQRTAKGKVAYTSFDQFVKTELGMSSTNAYSLMDISKKYTRAEVQEFGTAKLGLLLKAPEESHDALKEKAKTSSFRELGDEVSKERAKKGLNKRKTGRRDAAAGEGKPGRKAKASKGGKTITVANIEGRKTVKFTDAEGAQIAKLKDLVGAEARLELSNDVVMHFMIAETATGFVLRANTKREEV